MTSATKRVYLHIGAPKTGTTYLQEVLFRNRDVLRTQGVLYPGLEHDAHYEAVLDLRGLAFGGYRDPRSKGAWDELTAAARAWQGHSVVVSHELLAGADDISRARAVSSFGTAEVHVVYTARDLGRQVPAMWQESLKNRQRLSFEDYLQRLSAPGRRGRAARIFWRQQHVVEVMRSWEGLVPAERLHVVVVPSPDRPRDLLWRRFSEVVDIRSEGLDLAVGRTNVSLRLAEAELLRRVNVALGDELDWPEYGPTVKFWFAEQILAGSGVGPRAAVPESMYDWLVGEADAMAEVLATSGWDVVGDLDELRPAMADPPRDASGSTGGPEPLSGQVTPPAQDVLDAATAALRILLVERARPPRRDAARGSTKLGPALRHRGRHAARRLLGSTSQYGPVGARLRAARQRWQRVRTSSPTR